LLDISAECRRARIRRRGVVVQELVELGGLLDDLDAFAYQRVTVERDARRLGSAVHDAGEAAGQMTSQGEAKAVERDRVFVVAAIDAGLQGPAGPRISRPHRRRKTAALRHVGGEGVLPVVSSRVRLDIALEEEDVLSHQLVLQHRCVLELGRRARRQHHRAGQRACEYGQRCQDATR